MRKLLAIFLAVTILISTAIVSISIGTQAYSVPTAKTDQWDLSAADYVRNIRSGWNLGNTLEDVCLQGYFSKYCNDHGINFSNWTNWWNCKFDGYPVDIHGNKITDPKVWETDMSYSQKTETTKALIDTVHNAGFDAIRIPVSWFNWSNYNSGEFTLPNGVKCTGDKISPEIFARVKQITDWACENGMYVIINTHHDAGVWLQADQNLSTAEGQANWNFVKERFENFWKQIAYEFRDYGSNVVFAGMNEIVSGATGASWTTNPGPDFNNNMDELYQIFVDTVRNSGGNNTKRYLAISPWGASRERSIQTLPSDPKSEGGVNRIIIEYHIYNEWSYANSGGNYADSFSNWESRYLSRGYGVIIGEGAFTDAFNDDQREASTQLAYAASKIYGIPFFQWDNGGMGGTQSAKYRFVDKSQAWCILNRTNLTWKYPKQLKAMMDVSHTFDNNADTATVKDKYNYYYQNPYHCDFSSENMLKNVKWRKGLYNTDGTVNTNTQTNIYAEKINVTPGQTYEIRNNFYYGSSEILRLKVYGFDASGNKVSLGNGTRTKSVAYFAQPKFSQSSIGTDVNLDAEFNSDAKITIPSNVTSIAISAYSPRGSTANQLLALINSGIYVPVVRTYTDSLNMVSGGALINDYPKTASTGGETPTQPGNTTVTVPQPSSSATTTQPGSTAGKLVKLNLKGSNSANATANNLRFALPQTVPANAKAITVKVKQDTDAYTLSLWARDNATASASGAVTAKLGDGGSNGSKVGKNGAWETLSLDISGYNNEFKSVIIFPYSANASTSNYFYIDDIAYVDANGASHTLINFDNLSANTYQGSESSKNSTGLSAIGALDFDYFGDIIVENAPSSTTPTASTTQPTQPSSQPSSAPSTQPSSQAAQDKTVIDWDVNNNYYTPGTPAKGDFGITFTGATGLFINSWNNDTTGLIGIEYTLTGSGSVRVEIAKKDLSFVKPTADGVKVTVMFADYNITPSKTTEINFRSLNGVNSDVTISDIKGLTASAPTQPLETEPSETEPSETEPSETETSSQPSSQPTSVPSTAYTVKIDGVAIENNGSEFTFPVSTEKGFIAYTDGTNYYDVNDKIAIDKDLEFTTVAIGEVKMLNGASIRLAQRSGIRFETKVDTAKLGALPNTAKVEKGTLITLKELATSDLTLDSTYQTVNVKYISNSYRENGTFAGSIVNIQEHNIAKEFLGRGYVTVTVGDITKTIYADYAENNIANNTRSVAFVANAYKTTSADLYNKLDTAHKELVDKWASKASK